MSAGEHARAFLGFAHFLDSVIPFFFDFVRRADLALEHSVGFLDRARLGHGIAGINGVEEKFSEPHLALLVVSWEVGDLEEAICNRNAPGIGHQKSVCFRPFFHLKILR